MAKTRLDPLNQLSAGSLVRSLFNTLTSGSAVITKVLVGGGLGINYTGIDSGTGDVTLTVNGQPVTNAANFGDTDFSGLVSCVYSTKTRTMLFSNGGTWCPMVSLPAGESAIVACMVDGGGTVDFGDFSTGAVGVPNDLGSIGGQGYAVIDLGTF